MQPYKYRARIRKNQEMCSFISHFQFIPFGLILFLPALIYYEVLNLINTANICKLVNIQKLVKEERKGKNEWKDIGQQNRKDSASVSVNLQENPSSTFQ